MSEKQKATGGRPIYALKVNGELVKELDAHAAHYRGDTIYRTVEYTEADLAFEYPHGLPDGYERVQVGTY